jgi:hypothetical protein
LSVSFSDGAIQIMGLARMVFQTVADANLKAATGAGVDVSKQSAGCGEPEVKQWLRGMSSSRGGVGKPERDLMSSAMLAI